MDCLSTALLTCLLAVTWSVWTGERLPHKCDKLVTWLTMHSKRNHKAINEYAHSRWARKHPTFVCDRKKKVLTCVNPRLRVLHGLCLHTMYTHTVLTYLGQTGRQAAFHLSFKFSFGDAINKFTLMYSDNRSYRAALCCRVASPLSESVEVWQYVQIAVWQLTCSWLEAERLCQHN